MRLTTCPPHLSTVPCLRKNMWAPLHYSPFSYIYFSTCQCASLSTPTTQRSPRQLRQGGRVTAMAVSLARLNPLRTRMSCLLSWKEPLTLDSKVTFLYFKSTFWHGRGQRSAPHTRQLLIQLPHTSATFEAHSFATIWWTYQVRLSRFMQGASLPQ